MYTQSIACNMLICAETVVICVAVYKERMTWNGKQ